MRKSERPLFIESFLMALIATGTMLSVLAFFLYVSHQEEHHRAQANTRNLAWVLEEHAKATFQKVDIVLQNVSDHVQMEGFSSRYKMGGSMVLDARHELQVLWLSIPETDAVRITDDQGKVIMSSGDQVPDISVADRSYFIKAKQGASGGLTFSEPLISKTTGKLILVLARRLELPDGRFAGIVYAPIRLDFFLDFYRLLNLGPHSVVEMNTLEGHQPVLRFSPLNVTPISLANPSEQSPVQSFLDRGETHGTFNAFSLHDHITRTASFRHVGSFPFYILVGQAEQDYLASWNEKAIVLTITATLLCLLIGLLSRQAWQMQKKEHRVAENLKSAQAVAHVGSWNFDLAHNQLTWSDEIFSIFGLPNRSPVTYEIFLDHIHPEDRDWIASAWQDALNGVPYDIEHRIVVNGESKWVHEKALINYDENGRPVDAIGTVRDITEQKQDEERHRLAASVFSNSHDGIVITDPNNLIIEVNQAFCDVTGYAREEVLGKSPSLLNSGRQDTAFYQTMWKAINDTGHWSGEIWNRKKNGEPYFELLSISAVKDTHDRVTHYVGVFSDITTLKFSQQRLERLAHFDALTQLPNRILLADRMEQDIVHAIRHKQLLAICFIDLDEFKPINDQYGHETGDRLLIEVANRLKDAVRSGDTVARLGGDEFVLLLTGLHAMDELEVILSRVLLKLSAPYRQLAEQELQISASIGVTLFPFDRVGPDELLRHADQAMYAAKQAGRNRYHMFDAEQDRLVRSRREHLERLQEALVNGEFRLHYQPKVNLRNGQVVGAEALIRWQHPEQGMLAPGAFLPLAEESDLIIEIGEWVLKEALRQMGQWAATGLILPVSVNIAIRHLQQADFMKRLELILAEYPDSPPSWLELEILETTALADMGHAQELIEACRHLGVNFALDDFGTGYSSLSYLKRLSADTLKIDQSFIRDMLDDPEALAIVEGVIGLTTAFQRTVIAEGVETVEHGVMLMRLGCDLAQGYGIARPMPGDNLPEWVRQYQPAQAWQDNAPLHWSREEYPLLTVGIDHKHWVARVLHALEKGQVGTSMKLVNHHHCRFGRWYYNNGMKYYGNLGEFKQIEPLHEHVHELGQEIIRLRDTGQMEQAKVKAEQLVKARDHVLELLARLQIEVALANERSAVHPAGKSKN